MGTTSTEVLKKGSGASSISPGTWIVIAAAIVVVVGSFLPWVKAVTSTGSVTLNGISTEPVDVTAFSPAQKDPTTTTIAAAMTIQVPGEIELAPTPFL